MPRLSMRADETPDDPCVEAALIWKFVGVSGSSKDVDLHDSSAPCEPTIKRCTGSIQLMVSTGPDPTSRFKGPESPSTVSSKLSKPSDTDPQMPCLPHHQRRPS